MYNINMVEAKNVKIKKHNVKNTQKKRHKIIMFKKN